MSCIVDFMKTSLNAKYKEWLEVVGDKYKKDSVFTPVEGEIKMLQETIDNIFGKEISKEIEWYDHNKETGQITINFRYSETLRKDIEKQTKGEETTQEKIDRTHADIKNAITDQFKKEFSQNKSQLIKFIQTSLETLAKVTKIKSSKALLDKDSETQLINTANVLENTLRKETEDQINSFIEFLSSTRYQTEAFVRLANTIDGEGAEIKLKDLTTSMGAYKTLIEELDAHFTVNNANNPLSKMTGEIRSNIVKVENIYLEKIGRFVPDYIFNRTFNTPQAKLARENKENEIKRLEERLEQANKEGNTRAIVTWKRQLERAKDEYKNMPKSSEDIKNYLLGKHGDIGLMGSNFVSMSDSGDPIIASFGQMFRDVANEAISGHHIPLVNRFQNALKESGLNILFPEKWFQENAVAVRKQYFFDEKEGIVFREVSDIRHDVDPLYYEELSKLEAEVKEAFHLKRLASNEDLYESEKLVNTRLKAKNDFLVENGTLKFSEAYYSHKAKLREERENFLAKYGKDLDEEYTSLIDEQQEIYNKYTKAFKNYAAVEKADLIQIARIKRDKARMRSEFYQLTELKKILSDKGEVNLELETFSTLSDIYKNVYPVLIKDYESKMERARILGEFQLEDSKRHDYEMVTEEHDGNELYQETMRDLIDAYNQDRITQAEYNNLFNLFNESNWVDQNGVSFQETLVDLQNKQAEVLKKIEEKISKTSPTLKKEMNSNLWKQINDLVRPYREDRGMIDGQRMSREELKAVTELEKKTQEFIENKFESLGIDQKYIDNKKEIDQLYADKESYKPIDRNDTTKSKMSKRIKDLKEANKKMEQEFAKKYNIVEDLKELDNIKEQKSLISKRTITPAYEAEKSIQMRNYIINEHPLTGVTTFKYGNSDYNLVNGQWEMTNEGGTFSVKDIQTTWRNAKLGDFMQSDWYKENHLKDPFTDEMKPSHAWTFTSPKGNTSDNGMRIDNEKAGVTYSMEDTPSFIFKKRVVRDTIRGTNISLQNNRNIDKMTNKPKPISRRDPKWDSLTDKEKEFITFMTNEYNIAQDKQPNGARMGYRIPSIEAKFNFWDMNKNYANPKNLWEMTTRSFKTTDQDRDEGDGQSEALADAEGKPLKPIPHYFTTHLEPGLISNNIFSSIMKYSMQSAEQDIKFSNDNGKVSINMLTSFASDIMIDNDPSISKTDAMSGKIFRRLSGVVNNMKGIDPETLSPKDITTRYSQNNRLRTLTKFADKELFGARIDEDLPFGKFEIMGFRIDKLFNKIRGWKSFNALASLPWGVITWVKEAANMLNSDFQSVIQSMSEDGTINFTLKEYAKAKVQWFGKYKNDLFKDYMGGKSGNRSYFGSMMDYFNVMEGKVKDRGGEFMFDKNLIRKAFSTEPLWVVKNATEIYIHSTVFIAFMNSNTVLHHGKPIKLMDAFEQVPMELRSTEGSIKLKDGVTNSDGTPVDIQKIRRDIAQMLRVTQGAYSDIDAPLINQAWWGQGMLWMKKFWIPLFLNRFQSNRYDSESHMFIEGYWNTVFQTLKDELWRDPRTWSTEGLKYLSPKQQAAFKKSIFEASATILMGLLIKGYFGYDEDDEDRFKKMKDFNEFDKWALYLALKVNMEIDGMVPPSGMDETVRMIHKIPKDIFPYAKEMVDSAKEGFYFEWAGPIPVGMDRVKRKGGGFEEGDIMLWKKILKTFTFSDPTSINAEDKVRGIESLKRL